MDIVNTSWDSSVFDMDTYEISSPNDKVLNSIAKKPGHYTVKIDPLAETKYLYEQGFYYCGTLVEPYCQRNDFRTLKMEGITISYNYKLEELSSLIKGAFIFNRFHKDFNIDNNVADLRYLSWLNQMHSDGSVFILIYKDETVGFWGFKDNKILLNALKDTIKGKGLAKYFWSKGCEELFSFGYTELSSSIAISNVAVLNLYASLGFKFRNAQDVYHKFNPKEQFCNS